VLFRIVLWSSATRLTVMPSRMLCFAAWPVSARTIARQKLLWRSAGACHANFYNSFMLASEVYEAGFEIEQLVKEIQSLDLGRFDKAAFEAYLRTEMSNEELSRLKIV
jgi:hypothetical protein